MKKDKQLVLDNIKEEDQSNLHFVQTEYYDDAISEDQSEVNADIKRLKNLDSVEDRVSSILELCNDYATFDERNNYQCRDGANRSALDIWRLYNNYFKPVSIFYIMRTLYKLVIEMGNVGTMFCHDIDKQVFLSDDSDYQDVFEINELGIRFAEWRTIGLGE